MLGRGALNGQATQPSTSLQQTKNASQLSPPASELEQRRSAKREICKRVLRVPGTVACCRTEDSLLGARTQEITAERLFTH